MAMNCSFDPCEREAYAKGLCHTHWNQQNKGKPLTPIRPKAKAADLLLRDEQGNKRCKDCGDWKPEADYMPHSSGPDGLLGNCRACYNSRRIATKYGLKPNEVQELLMKQDGRCAICSKDLAEESAGMAIDHDHACCSGRKACGNCVRGILCMNCNLALGHFGDDVQRLLNAINYLNGDRV